MTLRRLPSAPACLLLLAGLIALPAAAQSQGGLRIQLRIVADCTSATARASHEDCPVPHQRSDAPTPVPAQVQALTPVDPARDDRPDRVTETY
ncbi:hypothetical protein [Stenotrophomonas sp.]|uniref:hypothetical protein n=1 Tax=Stenotrophomonas sp. TaxID=69392 RepID=UPI0028A1F1E2|nr:hypothetical protein [Stenotrophomonas sp.]